MQIYNKCNKHLFIQHNKKNRNLLPLTSVLHSTNKNMVAISRIFVSRHDTNNLVYTQPKPY